MISYPDVRPCRIGVGALTRSKCKGWDMYGAMCMFVTEPAVISISLVKDDDMTRGIYRYWYKYECINTNGTVCF